MGFFSKSKKNSNSVGGYFGYFGLTEWWLSNFTDSERNYILNTYTPMGTTSESLIKGDFKSINQSPSRILFDLASWFKKSEDRSIAFRLLDKAEELLIESKNILDCHFFYQNKAEIYYKHRDIEPDALSIAIDACRKQIEMAPKAKDAFLKAYEGAQIPAHHGYKQLAIIEEKQKNYEQAIKLCEKALEQGWFGDWEKRIERCAKKLSK